MKTPQTHQDTINLLDWYIQYLMTLSIVRQTVKSRLEYERLTIKMELITHILESVN